MSWALWPPAKGGASEGSVCGRRIQTAKGLATRQRARKDGAPDIPYNSFASKRGAAGLRKNTAKDSLKDIFLLNQPNRYRAREQAIESWMLAIVRDGGIARLDDLHIDVIDELWKPREMWIQAGREAILQAIALRERHRLPFKVALGFSLTSGENFTGLDFHSGDELMRQLAWSPPSLYLFEVGKEPRTETHWAVKQGVLHSDAVVQDLDPSFLGAELLTTTCYYLEFCQTGSSEYSRSVFIEG